jgi:REP-associated tyrosine transposase
MAHLKRLDRVWVDHPIFFITTCTADRQRLLATDAMHDICRSVWTEGERKQGWYVGRYVLMPDHAHFFCAPRPEASSLSVFVGKWKEWTVKYGHRIGGCPSTLWQPEFFDHVLRSDESYEQKWNYVRDNPLRAKLVSNVNDWRYQGELNDLRFL